MVNKFVYWTPRILSIIFIFFLFLFSLDVFTPDASFLNSFVGLLIHNLPVFILTILLVISWRYEIVGAIVFIFAGLLYLVNVLITIIRTPPFEWNYLSGSLIIVIPAFLIGILFLIGWLNKRK